MMLALCARNGIVLPAAAADDDDGSDAGESQPALARVLVICSTGDGQDGGELQEQEQEAATMVADLTEGLAARRLELVVSDDPAALAAADKVLLVLSAGVLSGRSLAQLDEVLRLDKDSGTDRLTAVYSGPAGWSFGCDEQKAAAPHVRAALEDHEAATYRPRAEAGGGRGSRHHRSRHEFPAMVAELARRLGGQAAGAGPEGAEPEPEPELLVVQPLGPEEERQAAAVQAQKDAIELLHRELNRKNTALDEKDAALAEKDVALAEKDAAFAAVLSEKDAALAEQAAALAEQAAALADLREQLANARNER